MALQAPRSMGFRRQEYWSGEPFPSSGDFPDQVIELGSPALAGRFFTAEPPRKPTDYKSYLYILDTSPLSDEFCKNFPDCGFPLGFLYCLLKGKCFES